MYPLYHEALAPWRNANLHARDTDLNGILPRKVSKQTTEVNEKSDEDSLLGSHATTSQPFFT